LHPRATNELLRVVDEKGKPIKYEILAKAGYTAPREVESNINS